MGRISNLQFMGLLIAALALGAGSASLALPSPQQSGPATVSAPRPKPHKFVCDNETNKCECTGASDCVDLKGSGQCADALTAKVKTASCTWVGPPPKPGTSMTRAPSSRLAAGTTGPKPLVKYGLGTLQNAPGRPNPMPYQCEFKGGKVVGCACTGISDCLKLDDSGLCGTKKIEDTDTGGVCY